MDLITYLVTPENPQCCNLIIVEAVQLNPFLCKFVYAGGSGSDKPSIQKIAKSKLSLRPVLTRQQVSLFCITN